MVGLADLDAVDRCRWNLVEILVPIFHPDEDSALDYQSGKVPVILVEYGLKLLIHDHSEKVSRTPWS
jgi:hypothetical protein